MNKATVLMLAAVAAFVSPLCAQTITFRLEMENDYFVMGETVKAKVDIINRGTRPVVISDYGPSKGNRLYFEVSRTAHLLIPQKRQGLIVEDLDLARDEGQSFSIPISEWYDVSAEGKYFVTAVLILGNMRYETATVTFSVVPGMPLASLHQYVSANPPVERDLMLVSWNRRGRDLAFLRTCDTTSGRTYGTLLLGPIMRVKTPVMKFDGDETVLIYRQVSRDVTMLSKVESTLDGVVLTEQLQAIPGNATAAP